MVRSVRKARHLQLTIPLVALVSSIPPAFAEEWKGVGSEQSGYVVDTTFMHPQIDLQFTVPPGTVIENTPQSIELNAPTWKGQFGGKPAGTDLSAQLEQAFAEYAKTKVKFGAPITTPVTIDGVSGLQRSAPFRKGQRDLVLTVLALPWTKAMNFELATVAEADNRAAAQFLGSVRHYKKPSGDVLGCGNVKVMNGPGENQIVTGHTIGCVSGQAKGQGKVRYFRANDKATPCILSATFADGVAQGEGEEKCEPNYSYTGGFLNGLHEGMGTMRLSQGKVLHGLYKQGKLWNGWSLDPVNGGGMRPDGLGHVYWLFGNGKNVGICRPDGNSALEANCSPANRTLIVQQAMALNNPVPAGGGPVLAAGDGNRPARSGAPATANANAGPALDCGTIRFARNTPLPTAEFGKYAVCMDLAKRVGHSYFRFISFAKTDGQLAEMARIQSYRLFYSATIETTRSTGSNSCSEGAGQQKWDCLMGAMQKRANGVNAGAVSAGARDQLTGSVSFEKFESGWKYNSVTINGN